MKKKLNQYVNLNQQMAISANMASNMLKDSLENYQQAEKNNPNSEDGNYHYLNIDELIHKLKVIQSRLEKDGEENLKAVLTEYK